MYSSLYVPCTVLLLIKLMFLSFPASGHQLFFSDSTRVWVNLELQDVHSNQIPTDTLIRQEMERLTRVGYLNASVDSINNSGIYLNTGRIFNVHTIVIKEDGNPDTVLVINREFNLDWINRFFQNRADQLSEQGYPQAKFTIDQLVKHDHDAKVNITVSLRREEPITVDYIEFEGALYLSSAYLQRTANIRLPFTYSPQIIDATNAALRQSPFLFSSKYLGLRQDDDGWTILFEIEEGRARKIDIIAGYNPSVGSSSPAFVGKGDIQLDNLLSVGSSLRLQFTRLPGDQSRLTMAFNQYWLAGTPFSAGFTAGFYQQDTTYSTRNIDIRAGYRFTTNLSFDLQAGFETIETGLDYRNTRTRNGRRLSAGLGLGYQNLDRRLSPTSGWSFKIMSKTNTRSMYDRSRDFADDVLRYVTIDAELRVFSPINNRVIISPKFVLSGLNQDINLDEALIPVGGAFSFRGYREEQFRVYRAFWQDTEVRYLLDEFSYLHVFGAAGLIHLAVQNDQSVFESSDKWLGSAGFGISYRTAVGFLQFTYAVSSQSTLSDGMVHFGIVNSF